MTKNGVVRTRFFDASIISYSLCVPIDGNVIGTIIEVIGLSNNASHVTKLQQSSQNALDSPREVTAKGASLNICSEIHVIFRFCNAKRAISFKSKQNLFGS